MKPEMESADVGGETIKESETSTPDEMQLVVAGVVYARGLIVNVTLLSFFFLLSSCTCFALFPALSRPIATRPKDGDTDLKALFVIFDI